MSGAEAAEHGQKAHAEQQRSRYEYDGNELFAPDEINYDLENQTDVFHCCQLVVCTVTQS